MDISKIEKVVVSDEEKLDPTGGIIPQEVITGDILHGRGPRRGNLERLLRYWRPIMKKDGGFRRCRVILANHPELFPLNNMCAWLHHETTGLWPNEGCHHPTMKNCKNKLKKLKSWSDGEFGSHLHSNIRMPNLPNLPGKSAEENSTEDVFFHEFKGENMTGPKPVVTTADVEHAISVLKDFIDMEPEFCKFLRDHGNWEQEGEDANGRMMSIDISAPKSLEQECCGSDDFEF